MLPGAQVAACCEHAVLFYDHDAEIVSAVAAYTREGLQVGDSVLLIATTAHHAAIVEALHDLGVDVATAIARGCLALRDARRTLDEFRPAGAVDLTAFEDGMRTLVAASTRDGARLRVFGEMVTQLWEEGDVTGAVHLESAWNDVLAGQEAGLLCSYPAALLGSTGLSELHETCSLHSEVHAPAGYGSPRPLPADPGTQVADLVTDQRAEVFVPAGAAVTAARRFVSATLESWDLDHIAPDALLVVSEMATNAVLHAESPFQVFLHHSPGVLHLSVRDAQRGWFEQGSPTAAEVNGRGVSIVEAVADRWGCDAVSDGKVVWAELPTGA
ncbi:MAG: MEDS domain-containing protein [Pedococcus sp.]